MKKILIAGAVLMFVPLASFAQTPATTGVETTGAVTVTTTITNPGLLPGDFFYFLDRWTEALSMAVTFNNEKKARKHLEYAKERVAEMGEVLKDEAATLSDVQSAKDDFDARVADAANLVKGEKEKGNDVAQLAREIDDELDSALEDIKNILKEHEDKNSRSEAVLRANLADLTPEDPQFDGLTQALESVTKEKEDAGKEGDDLDMDLDDEQAILEEVMGKELSEEKHLEQEKRMLEKVREMKMPAISEGNEGDMDAEEMEVGNLEEEIRNTERMMEDINM